MKFYLLFLAFLLLSQPSNGNDYSIEAFLSYIEENGYYSILHEIKCNLGDDVAISFCKEFIKSNDCDLYIRVYLICSKKELTKNISLKNYLLSDSVKKILFVDKTEEEIKKKIEKFSLKVEPFLPRDDRLQP